MRSPPALVVRFIERLRRAPRRRNRRRLAARGVTAGSFRIRDATVDDLQALARLHADVHNATRRLAADRALTSERTESLWRDALASADSVCVVVEDASGALVGFAGGRAMESGDASGQLDWIYLRPDHQRAGLGRRLLDELCRRFLERGVRSLVLFCRRDNPSDGFFRARGAERLPHADTPVYRAFSITTRSSA